jgi:hypothetical protein
MEFAKPTGLLEEVMRSEMIPLREKTLSLMRELLGPGAGERQAAYCEMSVTGICIHAMLVRRIRMKSLESGLPALADLDAFADHVVRFSLAGIAATAGNGPGVDPGEKPEASVLEGEAAPVPPGAGQRPGPSGTSQRIDTSTSRCMP